MGKYGTNTMRKLNKKQKNLINKQATYNYLQDKPQMYRSADTLDCYDELNTINCYENMDSDIERHYGDTMVDLISTKRHNLQKVGKYTTMGT